MMKLRSIEAILLYGHFYLKHSFVDGVNVIYGDNGGGKTTLLNILTNALNGNFNRFAFLDFSLINIEFEDGKLLSISKNPPDLYDDEIINISVDDEPILHIPVSEITSSAEILEKKYTELEKFDLVLKADIEVIKWLIHGHVGFSFLWNAFARCIYDAHDGEENSKRKRASTFLNLPNDIRFNMCVRSWAKATAEGRAEFPSQVFTLLGIP